MARDLPSHPLTEEPTTLEEEYEQQRVDSLPVGQQALVALHHVDQLEATPSYVEGQADDFVQICSALGIASQPG